MVMKREKEEAGWEEEAKGTRCLCSGWWAEAARRMVFAVGGGEAGRGTTRTALGDRSGREERERERSTGRRLDPAIINYEFCAKKDRQY